MSWFNFNNEYVELEIVEDLGDEVIVKKVGVRKIE